MNASIQAKFRFRLYLSGNTENSARAVANLAAICKSLAPGEHEIEFVDVFREPTRALEDRIFLTPTLVKLAPSPSQRITGTLSGIDAVSQVLGIGPMAA
jgi:circadian clock protein KaiB